MIYGGDYISSIIITIDSGHSSCTVNDAQLEAKQDYTNVASKLLTLSAETTSKNVALFCDSQAQS